MAKLFYLIGASGSGKDSLIHYLRDNLPADSNIVIAHRYITRAADAGGENHVALAEAEFRYREQQGCFAMHWFSHDTHYGIGIEIDSWLSRGLDVVINGSREYLHEAARCYSNLVPILISVDPSVLRKRLSVRGRENSQEIENRLMQASKLEQQVKHPKLIRIDNNSHIADAGRQLLTVILAREKTQCA